MTEKICIFDYDNEWWGINHVILEAQRPFCLRGLFSLAVVRPVNPGGHKNIIHQKSQIAIEI